MFRCDRVTVKREVYDCVEGDVRYIEPLIIAEDIPCHLSIGLENTVKINDTPYLISNFVLFLTYNPSIKIKENDTLFVRTSKNQEYKLIAGEVKIYNLTVQIKCKQEKIIES